jgi:hypothetical protein
MRSTMQGRNGSRSRAAMAAAAAALIAAAAGPAAAQAPAAMKTLENAQFRFAVALPQGCRLEEGPGTIDAVCSADLDPERSAVANSAGALVLEVGAEAVADTAGQTPGELAQRYSEAIFKAELPEAVCGEADKARVKIDNVKQVLEDARVVYTADVVCAEVKFLQLGVRRASVRYVIAPDARYRLLARAPSDGFESQKATIDAFLASFRLLPAAR